MKKNNHLKEKIDIWTPEDAKEVKIGVVTSEWNAEITDRMEEGCLKFLLNAGIDEDNIFSIRVPGAFELPAAARLVDDKHQPDAIICLGCVIRGETSHNEYINQAVSNGIMQLGIMKSKPFIFGVLTPENWEQAEERAGGSVGNKGIEAAQTALQMIRVKKQLFAKKKSIGFSS